METASAGDRSGWTAPRGCWVGVLCAAMLAAAPALLAGPAQAQNQNPPGGTARVDVSTGGVIFEPFSAQPMPIDLTLTFEPELPAFVFKVNPLALPGPGCQYDPRDPVLPEVLCVSGALPGRQEVFIRLVGGLRKNRFVVTNSVPPLPGPNQIQGGKKKDGVKGGQSDEKINTGKGDDNANPGKGKDDVNLGPGNDKANTKDGERDVVNGGKGKDAATVDKKDKVKNVEVVKRK